MSLAAWSSYELQPLNSTMTKHPPCDVKQKLSTCLECDDHPRPTDDTASPAMQRWEHASKRALGASKGAGDVGGSLSPGQDSPRMLLKLWSRLGRGNSDSVDEESAIDGPVCYMSQSPAQLFKLVEHNDVKGLQELLSAQADVLSRRDHKGRTALHRAAAQGHADVIEFIVKREGIEGIRATTPLPPGGHKHSRKIVQIISH
ncbi:uncharacterized protein LOC142925671 [Petromyzon marinus]|uniref:uncharacterized protein LOC142925671 n=1 Tax=Petromyzon marinus TaxID=7757 RepID=UPI003F708DC5